MGLRAAASVLSLANGAPVATWQGDFEEAFTVPLDTMPLNGVGQCFTVVSRQPGAIATGKIVNILKFKVGHVAVCRCPALALTKKLQMTIMHL